MKLYRFPLVVGLEDISSKLNQLPSANLFGALFHAFELKPVVNEKNARAAERLIEYLGRAFERNTPPQILYYQHILLMLLKEYDDAHYVRASKDLMPHEFLKALLKEDGLPQKSLVPDCFPSESQVSEFLHQKAGRSTLSYEQAVVLGKKFHVDPLNFLRP